MVRYANWYLVGARTDDYEGWCQVTEGEHGFSYDCWEVSKSRVL
jgi:hypothetical protein